MRLGAPCALYETLVEALFLFCMGFLWIWPSPDYLVNKISLKWIPPLQIPNLNFPRYLGFAVASTFSSNFSGKNLWVFVFLIWLVLSFISWYFCPLACPCCSSSFSCSSSAIAATALLSLLFLLLSSPCVVSTSIDDALPVLLFFFFLSARLQQCWCLCNNDCEDSVREKHQWRNILGCSSSHNHCYCSHCYFVQRKQFNDDFSFIY